MTKEEPYFVRVESPDLLRVSLLEGSKIVLHAQQSYYKVLAVRKRKSKALEKLKLQSKELVLLLSKLENFLPFPEVVNVVPKKGAKRIIQNATRESITSQTSTSFAELDKLNRSLSDIEKKLNKLG